MKNELKCYRCGTKINIDCKKLSDTVTCPHCQGKMSLDKKTSKWCKFYRILFTLIFSFVFVLTAFRYIESSAFLILTVVMLALLISMVSDIVSLWLTYVTVGLNYEHVEEVKDKNKNKKNKK